MVVVVVVVRWRRWWEEGGDSNDDDSSNAKPQAAELCISQAGRRRLIRDAEDWGYMGILQRNSMVQ